MFAKLAFVLAAVTLASGQIISSDGQAYQLVPIGPISGLGTVGLSTFGISTQPASAQLLIAGAAPSAANLQLIRQPAQVQLISAQPQTIAVAAPRPQTIAVAAPQPQTIAVTAPQPQTIAVTAPAAPRVQVVSAPAPAPVSITTSQPIAIPKPASVRLAAETVEEDYYEPGTPVAPYAFSFDETDEYGMNLKRQESSENGIVTGQYSFTTPEGYSRIVNYISDEKGFRAQVQTNEPGTITSQPADAEYQSSAPAPQRK